MEVLSAENMQKRKIKTALEIFDSAVTEDTHKIVKLLIEPFIFVRRRLMPDEIKNWNKTLAIFWLELLKIIPCFQLSSRTNPFIWIIARLKKEHSNDYKNWVWCVDFVLQKLLGKQHIIRSSHLLSLLLLGYPVWNTHKIGQKQTQQT